MSAKHEKTIHEVIADLRQEQSQQEAACLKGIKEAHANPIPSNGINTQKWTRPSEGQIGKGPGAIAKFSVNGEFIGWYREGQTSGLPSQRMPIEKDVDEEFEAYYEMLRSLVPPEVTSSQLGKRSGQSRAKSGFKPHIILMHRALLGTALPKHHRAKIIAKNLGCSIEYVRRTLRESSEPPASEKNTT